MVQSVSLFGVVGMVTRDIPNFLNIQVDTSVPSYVLHTLSVGPGFSFGRAAVPSWVANAPSVATSNFHEFAGVASRSFCVMCEDTAETMRSWRGMRRPRSKSPNQQFKLRILSLCIFVLVVPIVYLNYHTITYFLRPIWDSPPKPFNVRFTLPYPSIGTCHFAMCVRC